MLLKIICGTWWKTLKQFRWQRLFLWNLPETHNLELLLQVVASTCAPFLSLYRVKKLKETLIAVQQLDKNMSSLRSWLAHIESELSKPIVYETCDSEEIQRKLNEQQVKCLSSEQWYGENWNSVSLVCFYPNQCQEGRRLKKKSSNIKASGAYCVTYRAFCWLWHRIYLELFDIPKKGKAPRDVSWTSYCNCFSFGICHFGLFELSVTKSKADTY